MDDAQAEISLRGMEARGFRPLDRGELSLLAAFALAVVLAGAGLFLQGFSPAPLSQTATAANDTVNPSIKQECQAGFANEIALNKGKFTNVKDQSIDCYSGQSPTDKKKDAPNATAPQCKGLKHTQCRVFACPSGSGMGPCNVVGTCTYNEDGTDKDCSKMMSALQSGSAADVASVAKDFGGNLPGLSQLVKGDVNGGSQISAAFNGAISQAQTQVQQQITSIDTQIAKYTLACSGTDAANCDPTDVQKLQSLQAQRAQLQQQLDALNAAQQPLTPTCQDGQTGNPPNCTPVTPPCPGGTVGCSTSADIGKAASTFGNGLLQGLSRGLMQPPLPPQAPVASAPAQACSTDQNTYAQQQQQYQQQLQQYNYQLQQYQYQQQLNSYYGGGYAMTAPPAQPQACSPSTQQQCTTQPQQPAGTSCTGGSWQPIYSGSCIVNWQCSSGNAQLSCQPQTADVGMSIAITYSCAQGTASGNGFTASGQAGTSTAVIQNPPQGANTATFALQCTNGSVVSGAQCSVQIARSSIVLVANPSTISSGGTSQLGWVTAGMQSCVISSPTDATFTSQNSSNTSVSGTATTLPATTTTQYVLTCATIAGGSKSASTTVQVQ